MKRIIMERVMERLLEESNKVRGSHPEESYTLGWPKFDASWLDKEGLTTWKEDRKVTKDWYKKMGLL